MTNPSPRPTPLTDAFAASCMTNQMLIYKKQDGEKANLQEMEFILAIEHARQLERERAELMEALRECAEDLACELTGRYVSTMDHPAIKPKFERDMKPVYEARALLSRLTKTEGE